MKAVAIPRSVGLASAGAGGGGGGAGGVAVLIGLDFAADFTFSFVAAGPIRNTFPHTLHLARLPAIAEETVYFFPQSLHWAAIGKKTSDVALQYRVVGRTYQAEAYRQMKCSVQSAE